MIQEHESVGLSYMVKFSLIVRWRRRYGLVLTMLIDYNLRICRVERFFEARVFLRSLRSQSRNWFPIRHTNCMSVRKCQAGVVEAAVGSRVLRDDYLVRCESGKTPARHG